MLADGDISKTRAGKLRVIENHNLRGKFRLKRKEMDRSYMQE